MIHFIHSYSLPEHWAVRDQELSVLTKIIHENQYRVVSVTAIGGAGKSAFVSKLVDELQQDGIALDSCIWFSFYVEADLDRFLSELCRRLITDFDPREYSSPFKKSDMLREILARKRCLLILDGLDIMLLNDRESPSYGVCKDRVLRDFLHGICCNQQSSQIIITSRCSPADLAGAKGFFEMELPALQPESALNYMLKRGVKGEKESIAKLCSRYGYHALTLCVLSDYLLQPPHSGDISEVESLQDFPKQTPQGAKLESILKMYWEKLTYSEKFFMARLSAFRTGIPETALGVASVNNDGQICSPKDSAFHFTLLRLSQSSLLKIVKQDNLNFYTSHPLIKTYFYNRLEEKERILTHLYIKDYLLNLPIPEKPATIRDIEPLLEIYYHSVKAGLHNQAYEMLLEARGLYCRIFWWGHYSLAQEIVEYLLNDYHKGDWFPNNEQLALLWRMAAYCVSKSGDLAKAIKYHENSVESSKEDMIQRSLGLQDLGELLAEAGRFSQAIQVLEKAKEIEIELNQFDKEHKLIGRLGYCNAALGNVEEAVDQLTKAINLSKDANDEDEAFLCLWLRIRADLYLNIYAFDQSYQDYSDALQVACDSKNDFKDYEGHIHRGIGDFYKLTKRYNEASESYLKARKIAKETGYLWLEAEVEVSLALLALAREDLEGAVSHINLVLNMTNSSGWLTQRIQALIIRAEVELARGKSEDAAIFVSDAVELLNKSNHFYLRRHLDAVLEKLKKVHSS